jgi:hypothetical protein
MFAIWHGERAAVIKDTTPRRRRFIPYFTFNHLIKGFAGF